MAEMQKLQTEPAQAKVMLADMPPRAWRRWIIDMLDCLENETDPYEYRQALQALEVDIAARLLMGQWKNGTTIN
jgi:hypothetical protein